MKWRSEKCPYIELIGYLLYPSLCTRPDIALAVSEMARFVSSPNEAHWNAAKGIHKYLKGTKDLGLFFRTGNDTKELRVFVDASGADDIETSRSTTGVLIYIGGHLIDWSTKLQSIIAHSTAEAEYVAADASKRTVILFRLMLGEFKFKQCQATVLIEGNSTCFSQSEGEGRSLKSKHIGLRFHYLRKKVLSEEFTLEYIPA